MAWKFVVGAPASKFLGLGCGEELGANSGAYTIKPGDTLTSIANAHGTSVKALLAANPSIEDPDMIIAGHELTIPSGGMGCVDCGSDEGELLVWAGRVLWVQGAGSSQQQQFYNAAVLSISTQQAALIAWEQHPPLHHVAGSSRQAVTQCSS